MQQGRVEVGVRLHVNAKSSFLNRHSQSCRALWLIAISLILLTAKSWSQISLPSAGYISTLAGNGSFGYSGDGGLATSAQLGNPFAPVVDAAGNVYFTDYTFTTVRKINAATGIITTIAGDGTQNYSGDGGPATS